MKVVIAGASGLIGSALAPALRREGHEVARLVRRAARSEDEIEWEPNRLRLDPKKLEGCDALVNLSGENVGARWTAKRRERIRNSRINSTRTLANAIEALERKPRVLVNASAVGIYGDGGELLLSESTPPGGGFLAEVCRAWEAEAEAAERRGVRVARLRFGVVLARTGGALARLLPLFRLGLGGRVGKGTQWMSWVALPDVVRAIAQAVVDARFRGPINVVSPVAVMNAEFTRVLGKVLQRPTPLPVPAWVLRAVFGRMAEETLLASLRAIPDRLNVLGFEFAHPSPESALRAAVT